MDRWLSLADAGESARPACGRERLLLIALPFKLNQEVFNQPYKLENDIHNLIFH